MKNVLIFSLFIILFSTLTLNGCVFPGCTTETINQAVSPDKETTAVLYVENCHIATSDFSTQVAISNIKHQNNGKNDFTVFITKGWNDDIDLKWLDDQNMQITHSLPEDFIYRSETSVGDITIQYVSEYVDENSNSNDVSQESDDIWDHYSNSELGFSINIPKEVSVRKCSSDLGYEEVPVVVLEDSDAVYITSEYGYDRETCEKITHNLELVKNNKDIRPNWKISPQPISDPQELQDYTIKTFGEGCKLITLVPSDHVGTLSVKFPKTDLDTPEDERCFVNWMTVFRYGTAHKKMIHWDIGQESTFFNAKTKAEYDRDMAKSFRFL